MQKLEGIPLNKVWETISYSQKSELLYQLGAIVKEYHHLPIDQFRNTTHPWLPFIEDQKENLVKNHTNFGVNMEVINEINEWVNTHKPDLSDSEDIVPLHTELMLEHIFVNQTGDKWTITGLIDFEPAMLGHREYDFAAVGIFICPGDPHLFRQFMLGYGYKTKDLAPSFSRRIMSWLLLHRYCNLTWFCDTLPKNIPSHHLESLGNFWYAFDSDQS
jgi:hygromycin-B 7''-O-kinase